MKVALRKLDAVAPSDDAPPLLDPSGPLVVLGGHDAFTGRLAPSASSLYGPRAAIVAGERLWIADTGHHRVLGFSRVPTQDGAAADVVLGQVDFGSERRDPASATTMNMPVGLAALPSGGLVVADSWNHRVLVWLEAPVSGAAPDVVLGQATLEGGEANRGLEAPRADTLFWPFDVMIHEGRLFVADAGNRRVVAFAEVPRSSGAAADLVLGQPTLEERSDNAGGPADARTMRWPHALAVAAGDLVVADAGNNRVLVWDGVPTRSNVAAARVLGQTSFDAVDHNAGSYDPTLRSLNMPYGIAADGRILYVADTANSRLVGFDLPIAPFASATRLTGQTSFTKKGDNRWQLPVRDSLCWPYGISRGHDLVVVADTGNHRVLIWKVADA